MSSKTSNNLDNFSNGSATGGHPNLHTLLGRLREVSETSEGHKACCPAHDDSTPSLSISVGDSGGILLKCWTGCTFDAIVTSVGMEATDFAPPNGHHPQFNGSRASGNGKAAIKSKAPKKPPQEFDTLQDVIAAYERGKDIVSHSHTWFYHDADGKVVGATLRFETEDKKAIRPASRCADGKWTMQGIPKPRPLYSLPELVDAEVVYVPEGEKCADALRGLGLTATTSVNGAVAARHTDWTPLAGKAVIVLPDHDGAGKEFKNTVVDLLKQLSPQPTVKVLPLTEHIDGTALPKGGDIADWINAHCDAAEPEDIQENLSALVDAAETLNLDDCVTNSGSQQRVSYDGASGDLPEVVLPGGSTRIIDAATELGGLVGEASEVFLRGESFVRVFPDNGRAVLREVTAQSWPGAFEKVAKLMRYKKIDGEMQRVPSSCSNTAAGNVVATPEFQTQLPYLRLLSPVPLLIEGNNGELTPLVGYDKRSEVYATGEMPPEVSLDEGIELLTSLLSEFRFATAGDRSRAIAGLITPMLLFSGLLGGRAPLDLGEADQSQSGKGFRHDITAAIYGCDVDLVSDNGKKSGVGGIEEAFDAALVGGETFISLDNIRGLIDSQKLESFLTGKVYYARPSYTRNTKIDPRRIYVMMTCNAAEVTKDLANRSSCVRILKQPKGYQFKRYPEGEILDHVLANQSKYLGAVMAVVRAWHAAGKPRTDETRHSFRQWAQSLDWIVQNIFGVEPLLTGHQEVQQRMTDRKFGWLRQVSLVVLSDPGNEGCWIRANEVYDELTGHDQLIAPLREDDDPTDSETRSKRIQAIGLKFHHCFKKAGEECEETGVSLIETEGIRIERITDYDEGGRSVKHYRFQRLPSEKNGIGEE